MTVVSVTGVRLVAAENFFHFLVVDHDPELVHQLAVASMHGEFCTAISSADAIALCRGHMPSLSRRSEIFANAFRQAADGIHVTGLETPVEL